MDHPESNWKASPEVRTRLYLAQRGMLLGYLVTLVRDAHLAEDLFQEVGILVMTKGETVRAEAAFPAWLRSVARNKALNRISKAKRSPLTLDQTVLDALEAHWDQDENVEAPRLEALRACVSKLSPKHRNLIEYRYGKGVGGKRLAELLERPVNTIYGTLSRLHRSLGECVRRRTQEEGGSRG